MGVNISKIQEFDLYANQLDGFGGTMKGSYYTPEFYLIGFVLHNPRAPFTILRLDELLLETNPWVNVTGTLEKISFVVRRTVPSTQKSIHMSSYLSSGESHFSVNPVRNLAMQYYLDNLARLKKIAMRNVYDNAVERLIENFYGDENPEIHIASLEILGAAVTAGNKRAIPTARQAALEALDSSSNYYGRSGIARKAAIDVVRVLAHQGYLCQHLIRSLALCCWDEDSAVRVHALEAFIVMLNVIKRTDSFYGRLHEEAERVCSQILITNPDDIECVRKGFELLIRLEEKKLCDDAILNVILSLYERERY